MRADYLIHAYRDDRMTAEAAYTGQPVVVAVSTYVIDNDEVRCYIAADRPPVLVFKMTEPVLPETGIIWIQGECVGRRDDGVDRVMPGYKFFVLIVNCRVVPPPTRPRF